MKNLMRIFVVLICSLGLVTVGYSAQPEQSKQKKKQPPAPQHGRPPAAGHAPAAGAGPKRTSTGAYQAKKGQGQGQTSMGTHQGKKGQTSMGPGQQGKKGQPFVGQQGKKGQAYQGQTGKPAKGGQVAGPGKPGKPGKPGEARTTVAGKTAKAGKPFKRQHFNLPKQPNTAKAPPAKFHQGRHIEGSQNWRGHQYNVFRSYHSEWHDQGWWHSHYPRVVFAFGAPYYWNAGYWFPAWGYNANAYYAWDGPIYAPHNLPPDQVIANVQSALQQQGYYQGEVDGLLGPITRDAISNYQRDHGLYTTSTIDEPTLQSLGMA
jgi:hypothetical protein